MKSIKVFFDLFCLNLLEDSFDLLKGSGQEDLFFESILMNDTSLVFDTSLVIDTSYHNPLLFLATPRSLQNNDIVLVKGAKLDSNELQQFNGQVINMPILVLGLDSRELVFHIPSAEFREVQWIGGEGFGKQTHINGVTQFVGNYARPFGMPLSGYYIPPGSRLARIEGPRGIEEEIVSAYMKSLEALTTLQGPVFYLIFGDRMNLRAWKIIPPKDADFEPNFKAEKRKNIFSREAVLEAAIRRLARLKLPKDPSHQMLHDKMREIAVALTTLTDDQWEDMGISGLTLDFVGNGYNDLARRIAEKE